ncbi:MAG: hypothetical protein J6N52_10535 [Clostridia bacterium]|nr:hypothetical protein [Clostridia bacterium]
MKKILSLITVLSLVASLTGFNIAKAEVQDGEILYEETFDKVALNTDLLSYDPGHWSRMEARGSEGSKVNVSARINGSSNGNRYLNFDASLKDGETITNAASMILGTNALTSFGLGQDEDFTLSYDFMNKSYNEKTMYNASTKKTTEYFQSISGSNNYSDNATSQMYWYHKAAANNKTMIFTHSSQLTNLIAACGDSSRTIAASTLYTGGWNSIQYVVHASTEAKKGYCEVYLNGLYIGSLGFRNGDFARYLVFNINFNQGICEGGYYLDNIVLRKGAYEKQDTAKYCTVNNLTTGFDEVSNVPKGNSSVISMPHLNQPSSSFVCGNTSDYVSIKSENCAFGGDSNNKALHITNEPVPSGVSVSKDTYLGFSFEGTGLKSTSKTYDSGDSQMISFDFAFDENAGPIALTAGRLYADDYTVSSATKVKNLVLITQNSIKFLGGKNVYTFKKQLDTETWYNIKILFTTGSADDFNSVTIYLTREDGTVETYTDHLSAYSDVVNNNTLFHGMQQFWLHYDYGTYADGSYGVWYDNVSVKTFIGGNKYSHQAEGKDDGIVLSVDKETNIVTGTVDYDMTHSNVALILAGYDPSGRLDRVDVDQCTAASGKHTFTASLKGEINYTIKAFLFDLNTLKPLMERADYKMFTKCNLTLPSIYSSNAIVQQEKAFPVWGKATTGTTVTVDIDGNTYNSTADEYGNWSVTADPIYAAGNPHTIVVSDGISTKTLNDVLAGEVWMLSGQSNMAFRLNRTIGETGLSQSEYDKEIADRGTNDNLRVFSQSLAGSEEISFDVNNGVWKKMNSVSVGGDYYAVAYWFAQKLYEELGVPVGVLNCAYSGAPIQAFISQKTFLNGSYPDQANYYSDKEPDCRSASRLYNKMISPVIRYGMRGMLWYQGEGNAKAYEMYKSLQTEMVASYREANGSTPSEFPFYFAQLSAFSDKGTGNSKYYPYMREAQYETLSMIPNSEMIVTMDVGEENDIHFKKKAEVGNRFANAVLNKTYNMSEFSYEYPVVDSYSISGNTFNLVFKSVYDALKVKDGDIKLAGFKLCGSDGVYYDAEAVITSANTISVTSQNVSEPTGIRYGFEDYAYVNLFNSENQPAMPFRIE